MNEWLERVLYRFSKQSDTRRAALLGMGFGLLMCVIVMLLWAVFGFIAGLGQ